LALMELRYCQEMTKLNIGDHIKTRQHPWENASFIIEAIQEIKPYRFLGCRNILTKKWVNLVEPFAYKPKQVNRFTKLSNLMVIKLTKSGNNEALKEYVRRFKKKPKFK